MIEFLLKLYNLIEPVLIILTPTLVAGAIAIWQLKRSHEFQRKEKWKNDFRKAVGEFLVTTDRSNVLLIEFAHKKVEKNYYEELRANLTEMLIRNTQVELLMDRDNPHYNKLVKSAKALMADISDSLKDNRDSINTDLIQDYVDVAKTIHNNY